MSMSVLQFNTLDSYLLSLSEDKIVDNNEKIDLFELLQRIKQLQVD